MTGVLVILAGIAAFYVYVYRKFTDTQKLNFKIVAVYVSALLFLLVVSVVVASVKMAYENEQDRTVAVRMKDVEFDLSRGDLASLPQRMQSYKDYEADFEYIWERLEMYECSNRYLVYERAAQNTGDEQYQLMAQTYREQLLALCNPEYGQNADYAAFYLRRAGISK